MIQQIAIVTRTKSCFVIFSKRIALQIVAAILLLCIPIRGLASDRSFDEYQLKAVFLYRLALFVTWPDNTFTSASQPFTIGIIGTDPFCSQIDQVVKNEKVGSRTIRVYRYDSIQEIVQTPCQVLFLSRDYQRNWSQLRQFLHKYPTLTVSDMMEFGQKGGMATIRTQGNRMKIEINSEEARKAGLNISSKLLKIARQVTTVNEVSRQ